VCRKLGNESDPLSLEIALRWLDGLMPSEVNKLRQFEEENTRLRRVVANLTLDKGMLQEVIRRKL
jgi:putative transposase